MIRSGLAVVLALAGTSARAEIALAESLEWLVVSRPHIARTEVGGVADGIVETRVEFLKGTPPIAETIRSHVEAGAEPPAIGSGSLLFFGEDGSLDRAIDLAAPAMPTADFRVPREGEEVLEIVRRRLARLEAEPPPVDPGRPGPLSEPPRGYLRVRVPEGTPAWQSLRAGSACFLIVPADPEYLPGILEATRSDDPWTRAAGAWRLAAYDGEATERVLHALLADPLPATIRVWIEGRETEVEVYPARQAAFKALRARGVAVDLPVGWSTFLEHRWFE